MTALPAAKEGEKSLVVARLSAPVPIRLQPVGRWYEAHISRRQHALSSHRSSSHSSDSLSSSDGSLSSDGEDDSFLLTLDPKEWKQQDHYKVLGLGKLRHKATDGHVKKAFKKKVLKYHPDKKKTRTDPSAADIHTKDLFTCITKANEVLSSTVRRRAYDSVDPLFDDFIPSVNAQSKSNFLGVFGPVFDRNARWSNIQPVPLLGDEKSTFEEVDNFYSFWYDFDSWREFSYLDEEEKEKGENREERRWIEKQNKSMRKERKKEEVTRIRNLVDNAYACDPRIKKFKDEEKEKKLAEKKAKEETAKAAAEERERLRLEALEREMKAKEEEEQEAREKAQAAKIEKNKLKNAMKKERKTVRTIIKNYEYFVKDEESRIREMEIMDRLLEVITLESLQSFREGLEKAGSEEAAKMVYEKEMDQMREKMKQEAIAQTKQGSKDKDDTDGFITDDWTEDQTQILIKAVNLYPAGTALRWKVIADYVNMHAKTGTLRDSKHVIKKVKNLKKIDTSLKEEVNRNAFAKFDKDHLHAKAAASTESDPTVRYDVSKSAEGAQQATERTWTSEEQRLLENALRTFPASTPERWERIAESIPGRTKKECMKRYKGLVEMVKAKKAAQNKAKAV